MRLEKDGVLEAPERIVFDVFGRQIGCFEWTLELLLPRKWSQMIHSSFRTLKMISQREP